MSAAERAAAVLSLVTGKATLVEVGVFKGSMSRELLRHEGVTLYMVDSWAAPENQPEAYRASGDYHAKLAEDQQLTHMRDAEHRTAFAQDRRIILRMPSVQAARHLAGKTFDIVFIDADHSYEGCAADIAAWWDMVTPGGWLSGHDYALPTHNFGVERAVDEFAASVGLPVVLDANYTWFIRKP